MSRIVAVLSILAACAVLTSCFPPSPPPIPPCNPARNCIEFKTVAASGCDFGPQEQRLQWQVHNRHPSKRIFFSYVKTIKHFNQGPQPDDSQNLMSQIGPLVTADFDCRYNRIGPPNRYDQYNFTLVSACFEDDPKCSLGSPIVERPVEVQCSDQCTTPYCIRYRFDVTGTALETQAAVALLKTINEVLNKSLPTQFDLRSLVGIGNLCPEREPVEIQATPIPFRSVGSACQVYLPLPSGGTSGAVLVTMDATLDGQFMRTGARADMVLGNNEGQVDLEWFDFLGTGSTSLGHELLEKVIIVPGQVRLIGNRHYCIWLDARDG